MMRLDMMMYAKINGVKIFYEIAGQGKNVLTLHGGPGIGDHGDNKKMFWITPLRFAQQLAGGMPNARLVIFENAGHSIHSDDPEMFYTAIGDFLQEYA